MEETDLTAESKILIRESEHGSRRSWVPLRSKNVETFLDVMLITGAGRRSGLVRELRSASDWVRPV